MPRLSLILGLFSAIVLLWSLPAGTHASDAAANATLPRTQLENNSRCAAGSHWLHAISKPADQYLDRIAEWVTSNGPTGRYVVPQFRCISARPIRDPIDDYPEAEISPFEDGVRVIHDLWCGPGASIRFMWEIFGGEGPYTVSAAGKTAEGGAESITVPCAELRRRFVPEHWTGHTFVRVPIRVTDSLGSHSTAKIPLRIISSAPPTIFTGMRVISGWQDASAIAIHGSSYGGTLLTGYGGFVQAAVGRYRPVGSSQWIYFNLSQGLPPSGAGFSYPLLMSPLRSNVQYEVQGAWTWTATENCYWYYCYSRLSAWQDWTTPEMLRWSEVQHFWAGGPLCVETEVVGSSITVSHIKRDSTLLAPAVATEDCSPIRSQPLTWLTSPDWPGVIWAYNFRAPRPSWDEDPEAASRFIAHYLGLPQHSEFVLTIQEPLPRSFRQAPSQSVNVRTGATPIHVTAPGVDPSDIEIRVGGDRIIVEWTDQHPYLGVNIQLYSENTFHSDRVISHLKDDGRRGTTFMNLDGRSPFTLYISLQALEPLGDGSGYPFVCMVREIRLPPSGPDAYFDRYFATPTDETVAEVTPGDIPSVTVDYPYRYHHAGPCRLAFYAYP